MVINGDNDVGVGRMNNKIIKLIDDYHNCIGGGYLIVAADDELLLFQ